jgi:hypothetical protein
MGLGVENVMAEAIADLAETRAEAPQKEGGFWENWGADIADGLSDPFNAAALAAAAAIAGTAIYGKIAKAKEEKEAPRLPKREAKSLGEDRQGLPTRRDALKAFTWGGLIAGAMLSPLRGLVRAAEAVARQTLRAILDSYIAIEARLGRRISAEAFQREFLREVRAARQTALKYQIEHTPATATLRYRRAVEDTFGRILKQPLDSPDTFTTADWDVKFLQPLITILSINHPDEFSRHFRNAVAQVLPALMNMQRGGLIRVDSDIPSSWKSWTGMAKVDEWVQINNQWAKTEFNGVRPKFELDTLLGISLFLALIRYDQNYPGLNLYQPQFKEQFLFDGLRASLAGVPIDGVEMYRTLNEFNRFVSGSYMNLFYGGMMDELGLAAGARWELRVDIGQAIQERRVLELARMVEKAYPHLELRGSEDHLFDQLMIARPMMTQILGSKAFWGGEARSVSQVMRREVFRPILTILRIMNVLPVLQELYEGHDDPTLAKVLQDWKDKKFTLIWEGTRVAFGPYRLDELTEKSFDFSKTPPGFERRIRYLFGLRRRAGGNDTLMQLVRMWIRDEVLETAVSMDVGRKMFWIRYGLENGLIRVDRGEVKSVAGLIEKIRRMKKLIPYVSRFFGIERFELNNPDHIGKLSAMEQASSRMRLSPYSWNFILHASNQAEIKEEVRNILFAATRNEQWRAGDFNFSDPASGADQVGSVMGWVMRRMIDGFDGTQEKGATLTRLLNDDAKRRVIIDLANRKRQALNQLVSLRSPAITEASLRTDLSLIGDVLAQATDAVEAGVLAGQRNWDNWVAQQERLIERLREYQKQDRRPEGERQGRLDPRTGERVLALAAETKDFMTQAWMLAMSEPGKREAAALGAAVRTLKTQLGRALAEIRASSESRELAAEISGFATGADTQAQAFEEVLAAGIFGDVREGDIQSVQLFDLSEGILTLQDLKNPEFLAQYFKGLTAHQIALVVPEARYEEVRAVIAEGYAGRVRLIRADSLEKGLAEVTSQFAGHRVVVNTLSESRLTRDDVSDQIFEISTEREVFTGLKEAEFLRRTVVFGGRNVASSGQLAGGLEERGIAAPGSDYVRFTVQNLAGLIEALTVEFSAERLRAKSA